MSELGPGCVKTCTTRELTELFSLFSSFGGDCQSCSIPIRRNRDKRSTRKSGVGVFTQPGSKTEVDLADADFRFTLKADIKLSTSGCNPVALTTDDL
jgi:hypothetical protein